MAPTYNLNTINGRLQVVANNIDAGGGNGFLQLLVFSTVISTVQLARPCGTVSGGVLTFLGTLLDPSAAGTGIVNGARITDSTGTIVVSNLTVGLPLSGDDVVISNGLSSTLITAGQVVQVLAAQITGS